jgi:hypothetical protein
MTTTAVTVRGSSDRCDCDPECSLSLRPTGRFEFGCVRQSFGRSLIGMTSPLWDSRGQPLPRRRCSSLGDESGYLRIAITESFAAPGPIEADGDYSRSVREGGAV